MAEHDINTDPFRALEEGESKDEEKVTIGDVVRDVNDTIRNSPGYKLFHWHKCSNPACEYKVRGVISIRNPHLNQTKCPLCANDLEVID